MGVAARDGARSGYTAGVTIRLIALAVLLIVPLVSGTAAASSDSSLSGSEGHPRGRFPLAVYAPPADDPLMAPALLPRKAWSPQLHRRRFRQ